MVFGFNEVAHKQFNKNFLKTVVFQIGYSSIKDFAILKADIINCFKELFPRVSDSTSAGIEISFNNNIQTPIVNHIKNDFGIEMRSANGQKILSITNNSLSLTISGKEYQSYDELKKSISELPVFLELSKVTQLNRIAIRKINIIDFKNNSNSYEIISSLLNPSILGDLTAFPNADLVKQKLSSLNLKKDHYCLNLKYGLNIPDLPNINIGQVIIDLDLFYTLNIEATKLFEISDIINDEIFRAFNWVVSTKTIELLNA